MNKKYIANFALLLFVLIISFVFLEVAFRFFGMGEYEQSRAYIIIKHGDYSPFLIFNPQINKAIPQKNGEVAHWNSQGFRMNKALPFNKKANEYRIIALGDSTTEDLANRQNKYWTKEAEELLQNYSLQNKKISIINSGRNGYSSAQMLVRLEFDLLPFNPDMVTLMTNINDLSVNFFPSDNRTNYANKYLDVGLLAIPSTIKDSFLSKSRVLVFTYKSLNTIKSTFTSKTIVTDNGEKVLSNIHYSKKPTELKFKEEFRNNLISIVAIAKAHNITVILMSQPATFSEDKYALMFGYQSYNNRIFYPKIDEFKNMFLEYNGVVKEVAEQENIDFIDMYNLMGNDKKYFVDVVHYSPDGVTRFAKIYSNNIKKTIKMK